LVPFLPHPPPLYSNAGQQKTLPRPLVSFSSFPPPQRYWLLIEETPIGEKKGERLLVFPPFSFPNSPCYKRKKGFSFFSPPGGSKQQNLIRGVFFFPPLFFPVAWARLKLYCFFYPTAYLSLVFQCTPIIVAATFPPFPPLGPFFSLPECRP